MAKIKYDGVVEAVHYTPDGQVDWVRAYLRHGFIFSDRMMLDRETLMDYIKSGKRIVIGKRVPLMGANFEVSEAINIVKNNGHESLVVGEAQPGQDHLAGVPMI